MGKKKIGILIIVSIILIGFAVFSIVSDDLTTVKMIFGRTARETSSEVGAQTPEEQQDPVEGEKEVASTDNTTDEEGNIDVENTTADENNVTSNNTTKNEVKENTTVLGISGNQSGVIDSGKVGETEHLKNATKQNTVAEKNTTSKNPVNNTTTASASTTKNTTVAKADTSTQTVGATENKNNTSSGSTTNTDSKNSSKNTSNTEKSTVGVSKLPHTGSVQFLIWLLGAVSVVAVLSIVSNLKYRDIP